MGATRESARDRACCARGEFPPNVRKAATPPAATPPTTNANLRIIISPMRKNPKHTPSANARRSIVWAVDYTTRSRCVFRLFQSASALLRCRGLPPWSRGARRGAGRSASHSAFRRARLRKASTARRSSSSSQHHLTGPVRWPSWIARASAFGQLGSLAQTALVILGQSEGDIDASPHEMQPAQLPIAHAVLPGPPPHGPHETDLLGDSLDGEQPGRARPETGRPGARKIVQRGRRDRLLRFHRCRDSRSSTRSTVPSGFPSADCRSR